jgi:hypothetical protein
MTDTHDLRNQWFDDKSEPVKYETPMTEIEEVKSQIKVLEAKLSFLEELERTKSPMEEAYKDAYGNYPVKDVSEELTSKDSWNVISWSAFQKGYNAAYEGKVAVAEVEEEPEELKTLYQMLYDRIWIESSCNQICDIVREWMSQYTHNVVRTEYQEGYNGCLDVLKYNLK